MVFFCFFGKGKNRNVGDGGRGLGYIVYIVEEMFILYFKKLFM